MAVGHAALCIKFFLFFINFTVWVAGLVVFGLGIYALVENGNLTYYADIVESDSKTFGWALIGLGLFGAIIGFAGCYGAVREHRGMLIGYAITLAVLFMAQLATGGIGFHYRGKLESIIEDGMRKSLDKYTGHGSLSKAWDKVQSGLHCCGVVNYTDWQQNNTIWYKEHDIGQYPLSCCKDTVNSTCTAPYKEACYSKVYSELRSHWGALTGCVVGFAFVQVMAIVASCILQRNIHQNQYMYV